ncbi:Nucleolar protein 12 [Penicillium malachiteum]|uniref:Nucleolar protein 12 n=1 Tax=Penicillium malachiteum TaxID=1324776 RepID=UPI002547F89D|nr:Nucleolar protein 12 [Penicillium malachiteum]KAJ5728632.1 Nucleolar protein 12 [Penicillium malachiteum]
MGKKSKSQSKADTQTPAASEGLPLIGSSSLDPTLSSLFTQSAGPVKAPAVQYVNVPSKSTKKVEEEQQEEEDDEELSEAGSDELMDDAPEDSDSESAEEPAAETQSRKRKRGAAGEEVEETYMRRIAKEEEREDEKRKAERAKRQKSTGEEEADADADSSEEKDSEAEDSDEEDDAPVPVHESVSGTQKASDVEKSSRTVFLGNVSNQAIKSKTAKKTLLRHLASFCSALPESTGPHKVESIRFRSVAFASGGGIPKRASFARREILDETTASTNAYAVYSTVQAARKAPAALNGTIVLDRHLRVDSVAHPAAIDNKRCIFVGNLDFVDQEGQTEDENGKKKKVRAAADVEEGLWRTFNEHTGDTKDKKSVKKNVEFVRVIRDQSTRVGKGFAYVQFYDGNGVEQALLLNEKKFPPMLPRKLRVTRARKIAKKQESGGRDSKLAEAQKTLQGRAGKLLGRAGAHKVKEDAKNTIAGNSLVFEGHRATEKDNSGLRKQKSRGSKGSKAKKNARSVKRAAAYKAAGGQRP